MKVVAPDGTEMRACRDPDGAVQALHAEVARRRADGWQLVVDNLAVEALGPAAVSAQPELERQVEHDPTDAVTWGMLAEAWTKAGDPRGACVDLAQPARTTDPSEFLRQRAAAAPAQRLRDGHFYGALGDDAYRVVASVARGLVGAVELPYELHAPGRTTARLVELVMTNPFARFLSGLTVRAADVDGVLDVLRSVGARSLQRLSVRQLGDRAGAPIRVGAAIAELPRLRRLVLQLEHAPVAWEASPCPSLRELEVDPPGSRAQGLDFLAWIDRQPALESVALGWGLDGAEAGQVDALLAPWMADPARWPAALREVRWRGQAAVRGA
ncbi:MAG: hypothetical protein R3B06_04425 [Kofleriaceae bacterium]